MAYRKRETGNGTIDNWGTSLSVEKMLMARLDAVRAALVDKAIELSWKPEAVDQILESAGLEPYTRYYEVDVEVVTPNRVRVRATDPDAAARMATTAGEHLVAVTEAS